MAAHSASESTAVVRVLVVDDQRLFRRAAAALVRSVDEFKLVGEAETGEQAVELAALLRPELVLMDVCPELTVQRRRDAFSKSFQMRGSAWCRRTRPTTCRPR